VLNEKSIREIVNETKADLKQFFATRIELLKAEIQEKARSLKISVPLLIGAAFLILTAWMTLTFSLVALVRAWFVTSAYAWAIAGFIVTALYVLAGGIVGVVGYAELKSATMVPKRTLMVLKEDKLWIDEERRAALAAIQLQLIYLNNALLKNDLTSVAT